MIKKRIISIVSVWFILLFCSLCFAESYEKISESGFGNIDNRYAWAMCEFTPDTGDDAGKTFLYVGTRNDKLDGAGELHRMDIETQEWEEVTTTGFGDKTNKGIRNLIVYENKYGKALYAGTFNPLMGAQVWRSYDGMEWKQINTSEFGRFTLEGNCSIRGMAVINGDLYAGTSNDFFALPEPPALYRFREKRGFFDRLIKAASWEPVITPYNPIALSQKTFSNIIQFTDVHGDTRIYVTTWSSRRGAQILASKTGDRFTWSIVMDNGFGNKKNIGIISSIEYNGYLYCGVGNAMTGCSLYRSNDPCNPDSWEEVIINPGLWEALIEEYDFGEYANIEDAKGLGYGPISRYVWSMVKKDGELYITTYNRHPDILPPLLRGAFIYKYSAGDDSWVQILGPQAFAVSGDHDVLGGFNDKINVGIRTTLLIDDTLYFGTATPVRHIGEQHGCEIWKMTE